MKKSLVLIILLLIVGGCISETERQLQISQRNIQLEQNTEKYALDYKQKQENLIDAFKEAYPEKWEEKLLEYNLQQEALQKQQQAMNLQQEMIRQQQAQQFWQNFWQNYQNQRLRDAQLDYYSRPYELGGVIYIPSQR